MTKYGLIGHPLGHSFSRTFHNQRFADLGIEATYENFDLPTIDDLRRVLDDEHDLCGFNVTIPYKQEVMQFLDELDPLAEEIGAVNCVKIYRGENGERRLKGYNTDILGFCDSLRPMIDASHSKALILGTGGVSKAVLIGLRQLGIRSAFVSRTPSDSTYGYDELSAEILSSFSIIVNCSPVGMPPNTDKCPAIPYEFLTPHHVCFDCVYIPGGETLFVEKARERGASAKSGYEMLVGQAIASYEIWTGGD